MKLPIDPDAVPVANLSPHRRIDPQHPGRLAVATREQLNQKVKAGARLHDLVALYDYDSDKDLYFLKPEFF